MPDAPTTTPTPAPPSWYRRLYLRVAALSASRYATWAMLLVSVVDASVFPIPPFAILVPMVLARPKAWWRLAILGTVASFGGGLIGYWLGTLLHQGAVSFLAIDLNARIDRFGIHSTVGGLLGQNFWILALLCSILPTPFKVVAIGSGLVQVPIGRFMLASIIGRAIRFVVVGATVAYAGPKARKWVRV